MELSIYFSNLIYATHYIRIIKRFFRKLTMTCDLSAHTAQNKECVYSIKPFFRILTEDFPEKKYVPRQKFEDRTAIHWGQRKLLLSEIEFLTNVCNELVESSKMSRNKIVLIYAGAAPGNYYTIIHDYNIIKI
jgi:hypothetical protein